MNQRVKWLRSIPFVGLSLFKFYYKARGGGRYLDPAVRIAIEVNTPYAMVVQIGSNDGLVGDPIFELMKMNPQWRGLFVEPVPYIFKRLLHNYGSAERFRFENCIIGSDGHCPFYVVDERAGIELQGLPPWWEELNSLRKEHILNSPLGKTLEPYIIELKLRSLSLDSLFKKHHVKHLDVLHIDAEGADWMILQQLNLQKYLPLVIVFEYKHLSSADRQAAVCFLDGFYNVEDLGADFFCALKKQHRVQEICLGPQTMV
jgi:FkbM family methyltransferase